MSVKHKDLKKVVKELKGAVKAHGRQAKTIDQHITDMGSGFKMRTPFRCWKTHERVPGTKKGAPKSCRHRDPSQRPD